MTLSVYALSVQIGRDIARSKLRFKDSIDDHDSCSRNTVLPPAVLMASRVLRDYLIEEKLYLRWEMEMDRLHLDRGSQNGDHASFGRHGR